MSLAAKALLALILLALAAAGGYRVGVKLKQGEWDKAEIARKDAAEESRRLNQQAATKLKEKRDAEVRTINDRLADALERLRERPERLAEPARAACEGATGAELSGPDAGFLEREAARADELRSALGECYGWIDQVTKVKP